MRRCLAIGAAAAALMYFLDPASGDGRRRRARRWLASAAQRPRIDSLEREESPETAETLRPPAPGHPPEAAETQVAEPAPATLVAAPAQAEPTVLAEPAETPRAVAVADQSDAEEAALPPPLPHDVLERPVSTRRLAEDEPGPPAPWTPTRRSRRRGWLFGATVAVLAGGLAATALALVAFDVVDLADDEPPRSAARALSALAQRQARAISIMAQPGARRLPVVGAEERLLLVVGPEGDAVLIVSRLDRAPAGRVYELWVISGNTPRPAGLFRGGQDTVVPLTRRVPEGATVALTLERVGGAPKPTSAPIYTVTRS